MNQRYLCPQNLLSVVFAVLTKIVLQVALVLCFVVLMIHADDTMILDYIK